VISGTYWRSQIPQHDGAGPAREMGWSDRPASRTLLLWVYQISRSFA
jgi:hypothetical protein